MSGRGQTLVLFSLTLLLLTLLVMMTIGIGVRIHERQQQQIAADAAAYSQAVITARTYNAISSLNRVLVAELASIAATQSLMSWTGFYHGTLNQARDMLAEIAGNTSCGAGLFTDAMQRIMDEDRRLIDLFEPPGAYDGVSGYDVSAGDYVRNDLYQTAIDISRDQRVLYARLMANLDPTGNQDVANRIARRANQGSPWRGSREDLYASDQAVTWRELRAAAVDEQRNPLDAVHATLAARGSESFTSAREATAVAGQISPSEYVARRINRVINPSPLIVKVVHHGTSYFGVAGPMRSTGPGELEGYDGQAIDRPVWDEYARRISGAGYGFRPIGAWAQDAGTFRFEWPGAPPRCRIPEPTEDSFGYIVSTHPDDLRDQHMWRRGNRGYGDYREWNDELGHVAWRYWPERRHTFTQDPNAGGIAIWPVFVDYDSRNVDGRSGAKNVWGQPKSLVNLRRDYSVRSARDPWDLRFRFDVTADGRAGTLIDLGDRRTNGTGDDLGISTALASGLTYYHRGQPEEEQRSRGGGRGHSREPPNFFNPFWRATLAASDVDEDYRDRGRDVERTLRALGQNGQANTLRRLRRLGFEALP